MQKKILILIPILTLLTTMGCHPPTGVHDEEADKTGNEHRKKKKATRPPQPESLVFNELFPFDDSGNRWEFRDSDGNLFVIEVKDTISDESDIYYKVSFREDKLDSTQDNWFLRDNNKVYFNERLRGSFQMFLPNSYYDKGGSFSSNGYMVNYQVHVKLEFGGREYQDVVEIRYTREFLHGFDKIYFADGIGIVRLIDEDGRWPIDYMLERATIYGKELNIP